MVASLDFFIAKSDGTVSWLESPEHYAKGVAGEDPTEFLKTIGCWVMGSRTYEDAVRLGWPYGDTPTIVLTRRQLAKYRASVELYAGDLATLVDGVLKPKYRKIWVVGGAMLARDFIRAGLADELRITIAPILLGGGTPFIDRFGQEQRLRLKDVAPYKNGMVELCYDIEKQR
jgi:dihydrofolate reductase